MINIIAFMGPSASGKSTLRDSMELDRIVTFTSRKAREGEKDGVDYHFISREIILELYDKGKLLEFTEYNGNIYATGIESLTEVMDSKGLATIIVDNNGAVKLKELLVERVLVIGVVAPFEECEERMMDRNESDVSRRLASYEREIEEIIKTSDLIINNSRANWNSAKDILGYLKKGLI
ncbi:guanylate kinase [Dethiosulfatibacter aminovorans DSM 17477]|uniref:Guanylate kinase n=1 Tax=Dethiosulfatibacter aminovorans DSM 17477 TaxID=1121476 RepID=A0A1M6I8Z9_9FIRM|nr:guanylate kinase [Dethiosulfatibacter aminovorans]SHJ30964.1 guanylate kinase [Dethiosulfatibacter aminovorans DSM 17477]